MAEQKGLGAHLGGHLRENGMLVALVAIVVLFTVLLQLQPQPVSFLKAQNITNIFLQNGHVIILALGMLLVIVAGHIDLSVGSVAAFTGAVAAWISRRITVSRKTRCISIAHAKTCLRRSARRCTRNSRNGATNIFFSSIATNRAAWVASFSTT